MGSNRAKKPTPGGTAQYLEQVRAEKRKVHVAAQAAIIAHDAACPRADGRLQHGSLEQLPDRILEPIAAMLASHSVH